MRSHLSRVAVPALLALALLAGCGESTVGPVTTEGTWVVVAANAHALPALVHDVTYPVDGTHVQVFVTVDTIVITGGKYRQHGATYAEANGVRVGTQVISDHGLVSRSGETLAFESDYYQNVAFQGTTNPDGTLLVVQDLAAQGSTASYLLRRQ